MRYFITHMNCLKFIFPYVLLCFCFCLKTKQKHGSFNWNPTVDEFKFPFCHFSFTCNYQNYLPPAAPQLQWNHNDWRENDKKRMGTSPLLSVIRLKSNLLLLWIIWEPGSLRVPDTSSTSQTGGTEISPGFEMESGTGAGVELGGKKSEAGAGAESGGGCQNYEQE